MDLSTRILRALPYDRMYLQFYEELQKKPCSKRYKFYRIDKDGILMHESKMYILYDERCKVHDSAHVSRSNKRDIGNSHDPYQGLC